MGVDFTWPQALILLPVLSAGAVVLWLMSRSRRRGPLLLRLAVVAAAILALAGTTFRYGIARETTVFVVDLSASSREVRAVADDFIATALSHRGPGDSFAVVTVGQMAMVDIPVTAEPVLSAVTTDPGPHLTSLADGLRLAGALIPADSKKRVVLFSDGLENSGDALAEARVLAGRGVRIDVVPVKPRTGPDVAVDSLNVPPVLYEGESAAATVTLRSTLKGKANVRLYAGRTLAAEVTIDLQEGVNQASFRLKAPTAGLYTYRAVVEAEGDSTPENNTAAAVTRVGGRPTILVVEREAEDGDSLAAVLESSGILVDRVKPSQVPATAVEMRSYAAMVLANVPAYDFSNTQMLAIESFVRDGGGGLAMVGGEEAYGLGGYFETPIERALPVYMNLKGRAEIPTVGLVSVIDKSGSMLPGRKLELAKEAAARSAELLTARDMVGVVGFDTAAAWVVEMQANEDKRRIVNSIASIAVGGGTNIYPGLEMAYEALVKAPVKVKHVILLTDGRSAFGGSYEQLMARMREAGITLTTVAIGSDSDTVLLTNLAVWGAGRYYYTDAAETVPRIFTKETMMVTRVFAVDRRFHPLAAASSPVLQGLESTPAFRGYVATTAKEAAEGALVAPGGDRDPILAHWQYGLGRAAAWTPDMKGRWSAEWMGTQQLQHVWGNLVGWLLPPREAEDLNVRAAAEPGRVTVTVETPNLEGETFPTRVTVTDPELNSTTVEMVPVAPGKYQIHLPAEATGGYLLTVEQHRGTEIARAGGGAVVPYSPEYRHVTGDGMRLLEGLAAATGGAVIQDPADAFGGTLPPVSGRMELWPWLLALAALLWVADVAARRLSLSWRSVRSPTLAGVPAGMSGSVPRPVRAQVGGPLPEEGSAASRDAWDEAATTAEEQSGEDLSERLLSAKRRKKE